MTVNGGGKGSDWQSHWADVLQEKVFYLIPCYVKTSSDGSALNNHRKNHNYVTAHVSSTVMPAQELWYTRLHVSQSLPKSPIILNMSHPTPDARAAAQLAKQGIHTAVFHSVILFYNVDRGISPCSFASLLSVLWYLYYRCIYIIFMYWYCFH